VSLAQSPVRGTQTFVGVMTSVWRRPLLTGLEVLWRWLVGAPLLALIAWQLVKVSRGVVIDTSALQAMTVFQPIAAFRAMHDAGAAIWPVLGPVLAWLFPLGLGLWTIIAAFGRGLVLRRMDPRLHFVPFAMLLVGVVRAIFLGAVWALWVWGIGIAGRVAITGPASRGGEPNLVLYCAMVICGSIGLYVVWAAVSWPLQLAPLLAMLRGKGAVASLAEAFHAGAVRGKLIEINMVMNIVKIAVLVLAMVFSASPLPFTNVATETFLACWWIGVILLYLIVSDYFHVVRSAAYITLWRAYDLSETS
jgi:hypothetical protein